MSTSTHTHHQATHAVSNDNGSDALGDHADQLRAFHMHAAVFAGGMVIIFVVNLLTNLAAGIAGQWWAWWSGWALIGWSLGIAVHGLVVRLARPETVPQPRRGGNA